MRRAGASPRARPVPLFSSSDTRSTAPSTRACRPSHSQTSAARGSAASCRPVGLSDDVQKQKPRSSNCSSTTARAAGPVRREHHRHLFIRPPGGELPKRVLVHGRSIPMAYGILFLRVVVGLRCSATAPRNSSAGSAATARAARRLFRLARLPAAARAADGGPRRLSEAAGLLLALGFLTPFACPRDRVGDGRRGRHRPLEERPLGDERRLRVQPRPLDGRDRVAASGPGRFSIDGRSAGSTASPGVWWGVGVLVVSLVGGLRRARDCASSSCRPKTPDAALLRERDADERPSTIASTAGTHRARRRRRRRGGALRAGRAAPRSSSRHARSPICSASSMPWSSDVDRLRIEKSA